MPKISILNAILHNVERSGIHLSGTKLEVDSETCIEYISKHVNPLFSAAAVREATFRSESLAHPVIKGFLHSECSFVEMSRTLGRQLGELLQLEEDIPICDIMIVEFVCKKTRYLSIHQIACAECFSHKVIDKEAAEPEVQLYKNMAVLPMKSDSCLIPLEGNMILRILSKSGSDLLADSFLGCEWTHSKKELSNIIINATNEVVDTYFDGDPEKVLAVKQAIIDKAPDKGSDDIFRLEDVAAQAFPENPDAAKKLVDLANAADFPYEPPINKAFAKTTFGKQQMKFESGVQLQMPLEVAIDAGAVEVVKNEDGTVDIRIKRQRIEESI